MTHLAPMNAPGASDSQLRSYPRNSAEAAARVVALALVANGRIKAVETAALDALNAHERLGLSRLQWHGVIHDLCADLVRPSSGGDEDRISSEWLDRMLDEIDEDATRRLVLHLSAAVVDADHQIAECESFVLLAAIERWGLHPDDQALLEPMLYGMDFQVRARGVALHAARRLRLL